MCHHGGAAARAGRNGEFSSPAAEMMACVTSTRGPAAQILFDGRASMRMRSDSCCDACFAFQRRAAAFLACQWLLTCMLPWLHDPCCAQAGGTIRETDTEVLVASIGGGMQVGWAGRSMLQCSSAPCSRRFERAVQRHATWHAMLLDMLSPGPPCHAVFVCAAPCQAALCCARPCHPCHAMPHMP